MSFDTTHSRRAFMRRAAQLGSLGAAAPMLGSLGLISEAAAAETSSDYKALVCVFLYGGNDYANTVVPFDRENHAAYARIRPNLALSRSQLYQRVLNAENDLGGRQFALNSALWPLHSLFNRGKVAPLLNVGALVEPTSKIAYRRGAVRLPPNLFSHNDQQSVVQSFEAEGASKGWGGRMGDLLMSSNGTSALTCVTVNGNAILLAGRRAKPFAVSPSGVTELLNGYKSVAGSSEAYQAMISMLTSREDNWLADEHTKISRRALETSSTVQRALVQTPESTFSMFPRGNSLAAQLKMVARLIAQGPNMGLRRQVFFVGMGGWDMHSGLPRTHPGLLYKLASALGSFYQATEQMGVAKQVTTFTASDFGRTLSENGDGTDHGWGGTQFVMGGAVKGGRIYGSPPEVGVETDNDVGAGRLIPTTSIDQFAATLATWFGLPTHYLPEILPNLRYFDRDSWDVGFL